MRAAQWRVRPAKRPAALYTIVLPALVVVALGIGALVYFAGNQTSGDTAANAEQAARDAAVLQDVVWPRYVSDGPLKEAYQFAVLRPDVLKYMPCYCGCGQSSGHRNNEECFITNMNAGGSTIAFDAHGAT